MTFPVPPGALRQSRAVTSALACSALLLLVGCTAELEKPTGLTDGERAEFRERQLDRAWIETDLPAFDVPRPEIPVERYIQPNEYDQTMAECVPMQNVDRVNAGAMSMALEMNLARYTCSALYPVDPRAMGVMGASQREYLYDYYVRWLVPCLESAGYPVSDAPSRQDFLASGPGIQAWTPWGAIELPIHDADQIALGSRCGFEPAGLGRRPR